MPISDINATAMMVPEKPIASQSGINSKANAEPKVPGAFGASPEPKPTPQKTTQRLSQLICLKLIAGLCKMLIPMKLNGTIYAIL